MSVPSQDAQGRRLLDVDQLAAELGRSRRWVYRQHGRGLPRYKLGRECAYRLADVEVWLERHRVGEEHS